MDMPGFVAGGALYGNHRHIRLGCILVPLSASPQVMPQTPDRVLYRFGRNDL